MRPRQPHTDQALATAPAAVGLPPELLAPDPRGHPLTGALQAVTDHGYPATSVALIIAAAGVSRKTFYDIFANKEECVLAAYDLIVDWLGEQIVSAVARAEDWPLAVRAAVEATLACLAADLRVACLCTVEILRVDRVGFARYQASIGRLAAPLRGGRPFADHAQELPPFLEETILGGVVWLIGNRARLSEPDTITSLAPDVSYFLLVPYLDIAAAQRAVADLR